MSPERGGITYGGHHIAFHVRHAARQTLEIAVHPDGSVVVTAPLGVNHEDVRERVARRARWIAGQKAYFAQFDPRTPPRRYVSGETHLYLGRRYRLKVEAGEKDSVRLRAGRLVVKVRDVPAATSVAELVTAWYAEKAAERLAERAEVCWDRFSGPGRPIPRLRIRRMRSRWGSMSAGGLLTLNVDLVRAPRECIDYVILHEFCHVEHPDHGPAFRARLEQVLPDWERRKHRLELTLA